MRITTKQRIGLILHADCAIEKLNSDKNKNKEHWLDMDAKQIVELLGAEYYELRAAMLSGDNMKVYNECKDIINFALFLMDKVDTRTDVK